MCFDILPYRVAHSQKPDLPHTYSQSDGLTCCMVRPHPWMLMLVAASDAHAAAASACACQKRAVPWSSRCILPPGIFARTSLRSPSSRPCEPKATLCSPAAPAFTKHGGRLHPCGPQVCTFDSLQSLPSCKPAALLLCALPLIALLCAQTLLTQAATHPLFRAWPMGTGGAPPTAASAAAAGSGKAAAEPSGGAR